MDDLTRCLYQFACERRMRNLSTDMEYQGAALAVRTHEEQVSAYLDEEQRRELHALIDAITVQDSIENAHIFQAALFLARELSGLVRV